MPEIWRGAPLSPPTPFTDSQGPQTWSAGFFICDTDSCEDSRKTWDRQQADSVPVKNKQTSSPPRRHPPRGRAETLKDPLQPAANRLCSSSFLVAPTHDATKCSCWVARSRREGGGTAADGEQRRGRAKAFSFLWQSYLALDVRDGLNPTEPKRLPTSEMVRIGPRTETCSVNRGTILLLQDTNVTILRLLLRNLWRQLSVHVHQTSSVP